MKILIGIGAIAVLALWLIGGTYLDKRICRYLDNQQNRKKEALAARQVKTNATFAIWFYQRWASLRIGPFFYLTI